MLIPGRVGTEAKSAGRVTPMKEGNIGDADPKISAQKKLKYPCLTNEERKTRSYTIEKHSRKMKKERKQKNKLSQGR